jgi:hypothetical protein
MEPKQAVEILDQFALSVSGGSFTGSDHRLVYQALQLLITVVDDYNSLVADPVKDSDKPGESESLTTNM